MFDKTNTYASFDLNNIGLLPANWVEQVVETANQASYLVHLDGQSTTSREPENSPGADIYTVDGNTIYSAMKWLYDLYCNELLSLAREHFHKQYVPDTNVLSSLTINYLKGVGARYEWHVDSNPLTGLLFVTTHDCGEGGDLVFKLDNELISIYPKSGTFILFDARKIEHCVAPLKHPSFRLSIAMNYFIEGVEKERPTDLDSYIYR